jgi:hypothetical protein
VFGVKGMVPLGPWYESLVLAISIFCPLPFHCFQITIQLILIVSYFFMQSLFVFPGGSGPYTESSWPPPAPWDT